jgi:flagellar protein FliO/FliZ
MKKLAAAFAAALPLCARAAGEAAGAAQGAAQHGSSLGTGQIMSWLFSTCAVVAFVFVLAYIVKKTRIRVGGGGKSRVLSQIPVGPKERIAEVKIAGRRLVVGVTAQNISLLADLGPDGGTEFAGELGRERRAQDAADPARPAEDGADVDGRN